MRALARRVIPAWSELCASRPPVARRRLTALATQALADVAYLAGNKWKMGFVYFRVDGNPSRSAVRQVKYLMGMPRVQQGLADLLEAANCGPKDVALEVATIALGKSTKPIDQQNTQLRALDMAIRMTTGYVPTRSVSASTSIPPDKFFSEDEFADSPAIAPTQQEPRNVTPGAGGGKSGGGHRRR